MSVAPEPPPASSPPPAARIREGNDPGAGVVEVKPTPRVLVETDPATFVLEGYSAHLRVPLPTRGLVLGLGLYGLRLPKPLAELDSDDKNKGWKVLIRNGYALFLDYHFAGKPEGVFVGIQTGFQRTEVTRSQVADVRAEYWAFVAMPRIGYLWHPFNDSGFYLLPWAGVGTLTAISGERTVGDATYQVFPLIAFATLHAGWAF